MTKHSGCIKFKEFLKVQTDVMGIMIGEENYHNNEMIIEWIYKNSKIVRETYCRAVCSKYKECDILISLRNKKENKL
jgi:hypothetical protein